MVPLAQLPHAAPSVPQSALLARDQSAPAAPPLPAPPLVPPLVPAVPAPAVPALPAAPALALALLVLPPDPAALLPAPPPSSLLDESSLQAATQTPNTNSADIQPRFIPCGYGRPARKLA